MFKGDKRGRSRQVLDSILEVLALGVTTAVQLMGMRESMREVRLVASRLTG